MVLCIVKFADPCVILKLGNVSVNRNAQSGSDHTSVVTEQVHRILQHI